MQRRARPSREISSAAELSNAHQAALAEWLLQGAKDFAIFGLGLDGTILSWNAGGYRLTGHAPESIIGRNVRSLWTSEDVAAGRPEAEMRTALELGVAEEEAWIVRQDGSRFPASCTLRVLGPGTSPVGFVKVLRDITRQREAEAATAGALQRLSVFQAQVAHELRNALTPIQLQLKLVGQPAGQQGNPALAIIHRNLARLRRLCDDLADASRLQTGTFPVELARADLVAVLQATAQSLAPAAAEAEIRLAVDVPASLIADCDAVRISQVLHNLLANAIRLTGPGGTVTLRGRAVEGEVRLAVEDNGAGLSAQEMAGLFQPFAPGSHGSGGMGLGLYLSRAIVQAHGGKLDVESPGPGFGATFTVRLPQNTARQGAAATS